MSEASAPTGDTNHEAYPPGLREEFFMRDNGLLQTDIDHYRKKKCIIEEEIARLRAEHAVATAESQCEIEGLSSKLESRLALPFGKSVQLRLAAEAEEAEVEHRIALENCQLLQEHNERLSHETSVLMKRLAVVSAPESVLRRTLSGMQARIEAAEAATAQAAAREASAKHEAAALEERYAELVHVALALRRRSQEYADAAAEVLQRASGEGALRGAQALMDR